MSTTSGAKVFFGEAADAYAQGLADGAAAERAIQRVAADARIRELEELAAEVIGSYHKNSDGYRGRTGQVQISRWLARLGGRA